MVRAATAASAVMLAVALSTGLCQDAGAPATRPAPPAYGEAQGVGRAGLPAEWLLPIRQDGRWGYVDIEGYVAISPRFAFAGEFRQGLARVNVGGRIRPRRGRPEGVLTGGKWGYIDTAGRLAIPARFQQAFDFMEGLASVRLDGKEGYIDPAGQFVIKPRFAMATGFIDGMAAVKTQARWGFIDKLGKMVVGARYPYVGYFSEGLAPVEYRRGFVYIDKKGKVVIPPKAAKSKPQRMPRILIARQFSDGLAAVQVELKLERQKPKVPKPPRGSRKQPRKKRAGKGVKVRTQRRWGYIDGRGRMIIPARFSLAGDFAEGLAFVNEAAGGRGYINREGKMVLPTNGDSGGRFAQGLAALRFEGKFGYIDKTGRVAIAPAYDRAGEFADGVARVKVARKIGYVHRTGRVIWSPTE